VTLLVAALLARPAGAQAKPSITTDRATPLLARLSDSGDAAREGRKALSLLLVVCLLLLPALPSLSPIPAAAVLRAQQPVSRLKGRVIDASGARLADAQVRAEAFFGVAAGTFAGQRTFRTATNAKGEWNILGIAPGIWLFDASAPGYVPEVVALPIRLLTPSGPNAGGQVIIWDLVLKPKRTPDDERQGSILRDAAGAAFAGRGSDAAELLRKVPEDADAEYLAGAGNVALLAHDNALAFTLFQRALERDPSSYRAALGVASTFLLNRDFDSASRAFDAARGRTHDKNEIKFLSFAIGDLQTIRVR
jgi:carboxypeptidase family protein